MSTTEFSNDDILNSQETSTIIMPPPSSSSSQSHSQFHLRPVSNIENGNFTSSANRNSNNINNTNNISNNINNSSKLKSQFERTKSFQNIFNSSTSDLISGEQISMISNHNLEDSLLESSSTSLNNIFNEKNINFNDNQFNNLNQLDKKPGKEKEIEIKEIEIDDENNDQLMESEITKKAKQNAKDSLLKYIPKIIDENINTKELKLFKYNFDNFDFSNIILMNNYLNNAKQINSLQTQSINQTQNNSRNTNNSNNDNKNKNNNNNNNNQNTNSSLNSSLNANYEFSTPFSSIFEHTVIYAISKQNEIIDYSVMNYFMTNLEFIQQLNDLSSYYLMNNGVYACQLKSILFDSKNGINILQIKNPFKYNFNLIVNNLNTNSLIASSPNFFFTNNNKVTEDSKYKFI